MSTLLGIFAKHWTPGLVKTRLAATLGKGRAAEVQRLFVQTLLNRFCIAADSQILAFDPPASENEFQTAAGPAWQLQPQGGGDLGQRMAAFFAAGLARARRVVLIGSDSPDLPASFVAEAFKALNEVDVVLGPAADGGYYLVGARGSVPPIFSEISWSTADVWSQTIAQLAASRLRWHELPRWYDVDTPDDLARLRNALRQSIAGDEHLAVLAERLDLLLTDSRPPVT